MQMLSRQPSFPHTPNFLHHPLAAGDAQFAATEGEKSHSEGETVQHRPDHGSVPHAYFPVCGAFSISEN